MPAVALMLAIACFGLCGCCSEGLSCATADAAELGCRGAAKAGEELRQEDVKTHAANRRCCAVHLLGSGEPKVGDKLPDRKAMV